MDILIIEDDKINSNKIKNEFKNDNVCCKDSILDAKKEMNKNKYDIIFFNNETNNGKDDIYSEGFISCLSSVSKSKGSNIVVYSNKDRHVRLAKRYISSKNGIALKTSSLNSFIDKIKKEKFSKFSNTVHKKESQSIWETIFENHGFNNTIINNELSESSIESLYEIWSNKDNMISKNTYKKPLSVSSESIRNMEREGLVNFSHDKFNITKKGKEMLKTMILGDERSIFDENKHINYKKAKANASYPSRKKSSKIK